MNVLDVHSILTKWQPHYHSLTISISVVEFNLNNCGSFSFHAVQNWALIVVVELCGCPVCAVVCPRGGAVRGVLAY